MRYLVLLVGFLALLILAALSLSARELTNAYVELQSRPQTVTDIAMRSRTTPTITEPQAGGRLFGAGLLAIGLVVVGAAYALLLGGERAMKQLKGLRRKAGGRAQPPPAPQYPRIVEPYDAGETRYSLPARVTRPTHEDETDF